MRIYTDDNGLAVNAISKTAEGQDVVGHLYQVLAGTYVSHIAFQRGPVGEAGVNGPTNEALLAILIHRLCVLNEKLPCRENSLAITKMQEALMWLGFRTAGRQERDVEGTNHA